MHCNDQLPPMIRQSSLLAVGLIAVIASTLTATPSKPNVIFILSDDQRDNSLGMTGHPVTQTPHLDRLAREGVFFNLPHAASIGTMGTRPADPAIYTTLYNDQADRIPFPEGYPLGVTLPSDVFNSDDLMPNYRHGNRKGLLGMKTKMARAMHGIDLFVGNLRKLLVEIGEDQNTIIVFTSDNGLFQGEHGLGGKTILCEESTHVPLIVYSPFLAAEARGKQRGELVVGQDVSSTLLDLCGLEIPAAYQGASLRPLMEGRGVPWREDILLENLFTDQGDPRQDAVRGKEFKDVRYFGKEKDRKQYLPEAFKTGEEPIYEELFNLNDDPNEQHNLAGNPEYATVLKRYQARCQQLVTELAN